MQSRSRSRIVVTALVSLWIIVLLIPVVFTAATSLKFHRDVISGRFAFDPTFINYQRLFDGVRSDFARLTRNSLLTSSGTMVLVLVIAAPAAYSLAQFRWHTGIKAAITLWLLLIHLLPPIIFAGPLYQLTRAAGIYDTPVGVIIAHALFNLPLGLWILQDGFAAVPPALRESAMIDGATEIQVLWSVVLPLVQGAISAAMILVFLFSWKEFLLAFVLTSTPNGMTVPIGIAGFVQEYRTEYGEMAAASLFAALPAFVIVTYAQRHIVRGLTLGAIKG